MSVLIPLETVANKPILLAGVEYLSAHAAAIGEDV
ncbi:hypothetical protein HMPREF1168_01216 [Aeromonas veronii AMC34]|uniref:Uncharacterized protein n=1 Tax=Aeromonas veronii AMC34 TaxID=1073383 RepID=K1JQE8_AERVE|nr:hypothetical protein HMPREF1168_01216 [Aeromonas veronii AMC34]